MAPVVVGLLCVIGLVVGGPLKTYNQRQEGELNIHAQLDNIVIVLIPASSVKLLELAGKTRYSGEKTDKGGLLQIFQKPHKEVDRYETVDDITEVKQPSTSYQNNDQSELILPVITSQQVVLNHEDKKGEKNEEREEEVVAVVEEMKKDTKKATDPPKTEAAEDNPIKESSTVDETMHIVMYNKPDPPKVNEGLGETAVNKESKKPLPVKTPPEESNKPPEKPSASETNSESSDKESSKKEKSPVKEEYSSPKKEESPPPKNEESTDRKSEGTSSESSEKDGPTIEDLLRPVAAKDEKPQTSIAPKKTADEPAASETKKTVEPVRLREGARKEKVIRYKPETKWAPELVDLLGPPRPKSRELEERQRFASLCSPGVWDPELKTCIMPGETRSRNELARFLEAMRFGIAVPAQ